MKKYLLVLTLGLAACAPAEPVWTPAAQQWQDVTINIETQPSPIRLGMNEFLLITGHQQRGFGDGLLLMVRTENSKWEQAIPDGALGVFRRALPVNDIQHDHLYVRLSRHHQHGEMTFDLAPKP